MLILITFAIIIINIITDVKPVVLIVIIVVLMITDVFMIVTLINNKNILMKIIDDFFKNCYNNN